MAYIYKITNDINGKMYIGKTEVSIHKRFKQHCLDSRKKSEEKRPLYSAMRKYGVDHFSVELLEVTNDPENREKYWINLLNTFNDGYNATIGGDGRCYLDHDKIIQTYKKLQSIQDTSKELNISQDAISYILHNNNISVVSSKENMIKKYGKITYMYSLNGELICIFPSRHQASKYIIDNGMATGSIKSIKRHISQVCNGERKSAYGFVFKNDMDHMGD